MSERGSGHFFEDFRLGQVIKHATPRTVTAGDVALYNGLFGPRFAVQSADTFARKSAIRAHLSTTCSYFTSCSARRCRIFR